MKRVAAADAAKRHPPTAPNAMLGHRLGSIFRAGGEEAAAMAYKRADGRLIDPNQKNNRSFH